MPISLSARTNRKNRPHFNIPRVPKVLCIDDDPEIHTVLRLRLRDYRVRLEQAYHGMQGVVTTISESPDVIVMDLAMPNGDGHYLLDCIKRNPEAAHIPIIVLTGMRDTSLRRRIMSAGADVFLQKPADWQEVFAALGRFIELRKTPPAGAA